MKKPGNFRKGKKAFKRGVKNKLSHRYEIYLLRVAAWRKARFKAAQAGIIAMMGAAQIAIIQSKPIPKYPKGQLDHGNSQPLELDYEISKAFAITEVTINTAEAIQKVFQD